MNCLLNALAMSFGLMCVLSLKVIVCGVFGFEPVLCWDVWYVLCDVRKNHLLECLCDYR